MSVPLLLALAAALANLALGAAVLARQPGHRVNRAFALFSGSVALWTLGSALALNLAAGPYATGLARLTFAAASAIPAAFLLFASVFPTRAHGPGSRTLGLATSVAAGFVLVSFTPLMVREAGLLDGTFRVVYGPLHSLFGAYFLATLGFSLLVLTRKLRSSLGFQRLQLRYILVAVMASAAGASFTNLVVPLVFGSSALSGYGPLFGLFMVALIAHSIVRHRLMGLRLVMGRGSVILLAATLAGAVFALILVSGSAFLWRGEEDVPLWLQVALALAIALAFHPLKRWLEASLGRYLYREAYDSHRIVRDASKAISSTLDLQEVLGYLCRTIASALRPDTVAVYTRRTGTDHFALASVSEPLEATPPPPASLTPLSPLPAFLARSGRPLLRDDLHRTIAGVDGQRAVSELVQMGGDMALPMLAETRLIGFLVVGPKLSTDPYFAEDVELLTTLVNQAAVAVNNAQLYQQVVLASEYIENILRTMDSGVITVDAEGHLALCNSRAEELTGFTRAQLAAASVEGLPAAIGSLLAATLADGQARPQVEAALASGPNTPRPVVTSTSALRDRHGRIHGALMVFSDLTALKALEEEKRRAERLAAFGALVSGIAHEIKNPLVAIRTFAELLPERFADTDFRNEFAGVVVSEIDRIDGLVERLRSLAAPTPVPSAPVDLREPINETLALLRARFERAHVGVLRRFEPSPPLVLAESAQLKQLFLNLFINAIEAMGRGGQLTIVLGHQDTPTGPWVIMEIRDTGPGIPAAIRASVFDPFVTTKSGGSGLGLAICRGIVDAHRGTIRAEVGPGGDGTSIVVGFPAAPKAVPAAASGPWAGAEPRSATRDEAVRGSTGSRSRAL